MKCPPTQPCFSGCCFRVLRPNKTQHIGPDRLVAEDSLCSLVPSRVAQQVPGVAGEDNCLSDHVISTLHTFCLSKCCQLWAGEKSDSLSPTATSAVKLILTLSAWFWVPRHLGTESQLTAYNIVGPFGDPGPDAWQQQNLPLHGSRNGCRGTPMPTHCLHL